MATDDHIDKLLSNAYLIPIMILVGTALCLIGFTALLLAGTDTPGILWFSLLCMVVPVLNMVGIILARLLLRARGYD